MPDYEDAPPFQFGIKHLLGLTFFVALWTGITVGWYPFSLFALPLVFFYGLIVIGMFAVVRWKKPTLVESVVVLTITYALFSFLTPAVVDPRGPTRASNCQNNLKQIALALLIYHERYDDFPPAYVADEEGKPMHSWRVLILPYLQESALYEQYDFNEPWNGPNNSRLLGIETPNYLQCPEDRDSPTSTSYVIVVGPETMWPGSEPIKWDDLPGGTANTIMVVEVANSGIHWMEPRDLDFAEIPMEINPKSGQGISSLHREVSWQARRYGAHAAMADGTVHLLRTNLSPERLRAGLTKADDGSPLPPPEFPR